MGSKKLLVINILILLVIISAGIFFKVKFSTISVIESILDVDLLKPNGSIEIVNNRHSFGGDGEEVEILKYDDDKIKQLEDKIEWRVDSEAISEYLDGIIREINKFNELDEKKQEYFRYLRSNLNTFEFYIKQDLSKDSIMLLDREKKSVHVLINIKY